MNKQYALLGILLLTLPVTSISAIQLSPKKETAQESGSLFLKGKLSGQRMIEFWKKALKGGEAAFPFDAAQAEDLYTVSQILDQTKPDSAAHKNAFKAYQSYYEGLAATFTGFSVENFIKENKVDAVMEDQLRRGKTFVLEAAHAITSASTYATAMHTLINLINSTLEPEVDSMVEQQSPTPIISPLPSGSDLMAEPYYKKGLSTGQTNVATFLLQAQGKDVPFDTFIAGMGLNSCNELTSSFSKDPSSPEYKKAFTDYRLFLLGIRTELEKFDVEKNIALFKTAPEKAKQIRFGYITIMNGLAAIINSTDAPSAAIASGRLILNLLSGCDTLLFEDAAQ